jgi:uncharacterized membrane protein YagU involved in acid resistance
MQRIRARQSADGLLDPRAHAVPSSVVGALAGLAATIPMTAVMLLIQRLLPPAEQTPQEPEMITRELLGRAGLHRHVDKRQQRWFAAAAHFGYGMVCGTVYPWTARRVSLLPPLRGPVYGLAVWAAGYAGWLPAMHILPPPTQRPLGRNLLLITAHLVWGAAAEATAAAAAAPER